MFPLPRNRERFVMLDVVLSLCGLLVSASGQTELPASPDAGTSRVEDRVGLAPTEFAGLPREEVGEKRASGFDLGLAVSVAYDDNIFLSSVAPEEDLVVRVSPRLAYESGSENDEGAHLRFAYRPSGVIYLDHSDENRVDHDLDVAAGLRGKQSAVRYAGTFRKLGDAIPDTGAPTDRTEFRNELRVAWMPREKLGVELAAGSSRMSYQSPGLSDNRERYGEVAIRYAYSPKTQAVLAYRVGRFEVDGSGRQTFQQATARVAWEPRRKISIQLEVGVEHREFALGSELNPLLEARIDWEVREGTSLYVSGYRREEASAFFPGQNYALTGIAAGVSQRIGSGWTAGLEGGWESASYKRVSGAGPAGRKDRVSFVRPSLDYAFNDRFQGGVFYEYSRNRSNRAGFGYKDHRLGVRMAYEF